MSAIARARVPDDYAGKPVSSQSLWEDDVWQLDIPNVIVHTRSIDWNMKLPHGVLTDRRHRQLLYTAKALLFEMLFGDYGHYKCVKPSSAIQYAHYLARLLRWMSAKNIYRFADLTAQHLITYRTLIQRSTAAPSFGRKTPKASRLQTIPQKRLSSVTQSNLVSPLRALIMLSHRIPDQPKGDRHALLDLLKVQRAPKSRGKTKRIPDQIAGPLFETARRWVSEYAPALIAQYQAADSGFRNSPSNDPDHRSTHAHEARRRAALQETKLLISCRDGDTDVGAVDGLTFRTLLRHLEAACFIVIAGFVGMRLSEIGSLRKGCLISRRLQDGRIMLLLSGILYKTERQPQGCVLEWVAGWDDETNPVRAAVDVLQRLREIDSPHTDSLFVGIKGRNTRTHAPLMAKDYRVRINDFAYFIGIDNWRFTPHQFRKTFARFVTKRDFTGLLALQRHFAHVSIQMTEVYGSWDDELVAEILDEEMEQDYDALEKILSSDQLAGQKGEEILRRNERFRGIAGRNARTEYLEQLRADASADRLILMRHEYGVCALEIDTAACGLDAWKVGPATCSECPNFIVTNDHAPYWRTLKSSLQSEIDDPRSASLSEPNRLRLQTALATISALLSNLEPRA